MPVERLPTTEPLVSAASETEPLGLGPLTLGGSPGVGTNLVRVLRNTVTTVTETFSVDGVATDPSPATATLSVIAADGTVIVAPGTATTRISAGTFSFTIDASQTALLDRLTFTWTSSLGSLTTTVEVVGGFLFSIAQARAAGMTDPTYTTDAVRAVRTYAETELERAVGYALVPRYAYETISAHHGILRLRPHVRARRSVSIDGVALTALQLAELAVQGNHLYGYTWPRESLYTPTAVTVGYEHGLDYPPPGAVEAGLQVASTNLTGSITGGLAPGTERLITDDGTLVFGASGGSFGSFSDPTVNRWVAVNQLPVIG